MGLAQSLGSSSACAFELPRAEEDGEGEAEEDGEGEAGEDGEGEVEEDGEGESAGDTEAARCAEAGDTPGVSVRAPTVANAPSTAITADMATSFRRLLLSITGTRAKSPLRAALPCSPLVMTLSASERPDTVVYWVE